MLRGSYVIVNGLPDGRRRLHRGRHRLGTPGTAPRYPSGPPRPPGAPGQSGPPGPPDQSGPPRPPVAAGQSGPPARRARHRRPAASSVLAVRSAGLVVLLGTVAVSGWFAAAGATAFAQMIQP